MSLEKGWPRRETKKETDREEVERLSRWERCSRMSTQWSGLSLAPVSHDVTWHGHDMDLDMDCLGRTGMRSPMAGAKKIHTTTSGVHGCFVCKRNIKTHRMTWFIWSRRWSKEKGLKESNKERGKNQSMEVRTRTKKREKGVALVGWLVGWLVG